MSNLHNGMGSVRDDAAATSGVVTCPSCRTRWRVAREVAADLRCRCSRCQEVFVVGDAKTPYRVRVADLEPGRSAPDHEGAVPVTHAVRGSSRSRDLRVGMDDPSLAARLGRTALHGGSAGRRPWTWTVVADPDPQEEARDDGPAPESTDARYARGAAYADTGPEPAVSEHEEPADPDASAAAAEVAVDARPETPPATVGPASLRESPREPIVEALDPPRDVASEAASEPVGARPTTPALDVRETVVHHVAAGRKAAPDAGTGANPERVAVSRAGVGTFAVVLFLAAAGALTASTWAPWLKSAADDLLGRLPVVVAVDIPADPKFWAGPGVVFGLLLGWGWLRWTSRRR